MRARLKQLDRAVYRAEQAFVVIALLVMAAVVFLDVVHRLFAAPGSATDVLVGVANLLGFAIEPETRAHGIAATIAPFVWWAVFVSLAYLAVRVGTRHDPMPPHHAAGYALGGVILAFGAVRSMVRLLPNGLIWSQDLALILTLWVGFIGASMCTFEAKHLKIEALERVLPPAVRRWVAFASGVLTALVCAGLFWLSLRYVVSQYGDYRDADGQGGLVVSLDAPKYLCFMALPFAFAVMTARFLAASIALARGGEIPEPPAIAGSPEAGAHEPVQSEVSTEVIPKDARNAEEDR